MNHTFDVDIAREYGLEEAILLGNLWFWVKKNEANEMHFHDGCYWTYNSIRAFEELFPYLSKKKLRRVLKQLIDDGVLKTGNYNSSAYDRTLWYAFTEKGEAIMQKRSLDEPKADTSISPKGQINSPKKENQIAQKGEPIPDIKPYINTDINTDIYMGAKPKTKRFSPPTLEEIKEYCDQRGNNVDAAQFIDYYEARGWELSKGRKVKDWKACIRTWERNNYGNKNQLSEGARGSESSVEISDEEERSFFNPRLEDWGIT